MSLSESERTIELEEEAKKIKEELQKTRDRARFKQREERSLLQVRPITIRPILNFLLRIFLLLHTLGFYIMDGILYYLINIKIYNAHCSPL